jgi:hypothetical protein
VRETHLTKSLTDLLVGLNLGRETGLIRIRQFSSAATSLCSSFGAAAMISPVPPGGAQKYCLFA